MAGLPTRNRCVPGGHVYAVRTFTESNKQDATQYQNAMKELYSLSARELPIHRSINDKSIYCALLT